MWEAIRANKRRSMVMIFSLAVVLVGLGYAIGMAIDPQSGGQVGAAVAAVLWVILYLVALSSGRNILLGSVGAREIEHDDNPMLFNVVEEMSIAAGLPKPPRVYVLDSDAPNAFAVGTPDTAAVAVTTGLLMRLNRDELQGVVAHEIGHVVNNDTRFMTLAGVMVAAIVIVADVFVRGVFYSGRGRRRSSGGGGGGAIILLVALLFAILAPILAQLLYFACSRKREFLADACSARFTRYPQGLASALEKISASTDQMQNVSRAVAPMFTVNPLKGSAAHSLWSTHPPTEERVRVLRSMAGGAAYTNYENAYSKVLGRHIIGQQTLRDDQSAPLRAPSSEPEKSGLEKARDAVDILHRQAGLLFLTCACGLRTKVPPSYKGDKVACPRCGREMPIPKAAVVAAAAAAALGATGGAAPGTADAATAADRPLTIQHTPGKWDSVRCACGHTIQLSPNFSASTVRCRSCGRSIRVEPSGR
jgi:heat shock protein HtpX